MHVSFPVDEELLDHAPPGVVTGPCRQWTGHSVSLSTNEQSWPRRPGISADTFGIVTPTTLWICPGRGLYPRRFNFGMQTSPFAFGHRRAMLCRDGGEHKQQLRCSRRISGMQPTRSKDRVWAYPHSADVLKTSGMKTVVECIHIRRANVREVGSRRGRSSCPARA